MSEKEFIWKMKLNIFHQADKKKETITYLCKKYGVSRTWFYKWKKRRDKYGDEGLRVKTRTKPSKSSVNHVYPFMKLLLIFNLSDFIACNFRLCL